MTELPRRRRRFPWLPVIAVLVPVLVLGSGFAVGWVQDQDRQRAEERAARVEAERAAERVELAAAAERFTTPIRRYSLNRESGDGRVRYSAYVTVPTESQPPCRDSGSCYLLRLLPLVECEQVSYTTYRRRGVFDGGAIEPAATGGFSDARAGIVLEAWVEDRTDDRLEPSVSCTRAAATR